MKKNLRYVFCSIFIVCQFWANGAHLIGGEMTYVCLGNGDYEITFKVYRDCQGGGAQFDGPSNGAMSIYNGDSQIEFDRITMPFPTVTDVEPDIDNPCLILPSNVCVQQAIYQFNLSDSDIGNINLPNSDESYYIIYSRCCRNNSISNLVNPAETGATFYVEITADAQDLCNDSPVFNDLPPIVICVNEDLVFDHSATDPDGDLLVYGLCSPLKGGGTAGWTSPGEPDDFDGTNPNPDRYPPFQNVNFDAPTYGALDPIGGMPILSIDPVTGILTGHPTTQGQFVVGICVKEYRNGILLSVIQRDFQFNVAFCEPTVVASVNGDDLIATDPLFMFSNCNGDTVFNFIAPTSNFINDYIWEFDLGGVNPLSFNQQSINVTFPGYGVYEGLLILNPGTPCGDTASIEVEIFEPPLADYSFDYDTCIAGPVAFTDLSTPTAFHDIDSWEWSFGDGQTSTEPSPVVDYVDPGIFNVTLLVTDENGCSNTSVQEVTWQPVPPLIVIEPSSFQGCAPLNIFFNNLSTPIDDTYDIVWEFGDGGIGDAISPSYTYQNPGDYDVHVGITSPIGCYTEKFFPKLIRVDSFPEAHFSFGPDLITNFEPEVNFFNESIRDIRWYWNFNGEDYSQEENPSYIFQDTGLQVVELVVVTESGCPDTTYQVVDIVPKVRYFLPNAFTPNDDTVNDEFVGVGFLRGVKDFNLEVWNRYGELVYETNDPYAGWNGRRSNGTTKMPAGVYVYYVSYRTPRGEPQEVQGYITLVK